MEAIHQHVGTCHCPQASWQSPCNKQYLVFAATKQDWNRDLNLVHLLDQRIDLILAVPQITTLDKVLELSRPETAGRVAQLERPEEVARLLEIWPHGDQLVDEILHAHDAILAQVIFDQLVVGKGDTLLVDLAVATFVDEFADGLEGRIPVGDIGFDDLEHLPGGFCETDEYSVVDLD